MPYLIDGHNLIPKIPGLSLRDMDDEIALLEILQRFCRQSRKRVEVYFDNAPPGMARRRTYGSVKAVFVTHGRTADDAIQSRLSRLGGDAHNWTVVSSDRQVQAEAHARGARVVPSQAFAAQLTPADEEPGPQKPSMNPDELEKWLGIFGEDQDQG